VSGDWLNRNIRENHMNSFPIVICIPNPNFEHGLKVLCIYLLVVSVLSPLLTVKLTCVSPPCRHVTSVLTVLRHECDSFTYF